MLPSLDQWLTADPTPSKQVLRGEGATWPWVGRGHGWRAGPAVIIALMLAFVPLLSPSASAAPRGVPTLDASPSLGMSIPTVGAPSISPVVQATLVLFNDSLVAGSFDPVNGLLPIAEAYDAAQGEIFVADGESGTPGGISVVNDSTQSVTSSIPGVSNPVALAYDPFQGELFAASWDTSSLVVVNTTTGAISGSIPFQNGSLADPQSGVVFDGARDQVLSIGPGGNLTSIDAADGQVTANLSLGAYPYLLTYASGAGAAVVSTYSSLDVVNDSSLSLTRTLDLGWTISALAAEGGEDAAVVGLESPVTGPLPNPVVPQVASVNLTTGLMNWQVPIGANPGAILTSPSGDQVWVANGDNVTVLNGSTGALLGNVSAGYLPSSLVWDSGRGLCYAANLDSGNLTVIEGDPPQAADSVPLSASPVGLAGNATGGSLFLADNAIGGGVSELATANDSLAGSFPAASQSDALTLGPDALAVDPLTGEVYVANWGLGSISVLNGTTGQVVGTVPGPGGSARPWGVLYDPALQAVVVSWAGSSNLSVIDPATDQISAWSNVGGAPEAMAYDPVEGEILVTNHASDAVQLVNGTTGQLVATVPVNGYPWAVSYDPSRGQAFVTSSWEASANLTVVNVSAHQLAAVVPLGNQSGSEPAPVPSGLAYLPGSGTVFVADEARDLVEAVNDTSDQLVATVSVGEGPTELWADPSSGELYVANTAGGTLSVVSVYGAATGSVVWTETGLPVGSTWSVEMGGVSAASASGQVVRVVPEGRYGYTVVPPVGFLPTPNSGNVTVTGGMSTISVRFAVVVTYPAEFEESGLPSGAEWTVSAILGTTGVATSRSSTAAAIVLELANGTYSIEVSGPPQFQFSVSQTRLTVQGASPPAVQTTFHSSGGGSPSADGLVQVGLPVTVVVVAIAVVLSLYYVRYRRWRAEARSWLDQFLEERGPHRPRPPPPGEL